MSPRNASVRNVWRASCRSRGGVLSSPNFWQCLRRVPRKRILSKRDHNFVVAWLLAAHAPIARSHPSRGATNFCLDCNLLFFYNASFALLAIVVASSRFDLGAATVGYVCCRQLASTSPTVWTAQRIGHANRRACAMPWWCCCRTRRFAEKFGCTHWHRCVDYTENHKGTVLG